MTLRWIPAVFAALLFASAATPALALKFPFTGTLEIKSTVGTNLATVEVVSMAISGSVDISSGVVMIAASEISVPVATVGGFSGTVVNGAGSFSVAGGPPPSTCPLIDIQELCSTGNGFGGTMLLLGMQQAGQSLVALGSAATNVGMTSSGLTRTESALPWTDGAATVWFYVPETDPTPFTTMGSGTFRGLPSTFTGTGPAGFSLVTPMMVTSGLASTAHNVRTIAKLQIDLGAPSVPSGGAVALAAALFCVGVARLLRRS